MKFIKYAVGLVIALSVIPLVVITVNNLEAPRLKTIEFEVVDYDNGANVITFSENTYNDIHSLTIVDEGTVINLITVTLNGIEMIDYGLDYDSSIFEYSYYDDNSNDWSALTDTNSADSEGYSAVIGDKWEMTFQVPRPLPPLIKTLVGFAPLLLIGGILLFMLNKRKLD